jgi:signal transduction histidine kinase
LTLWYILVLSIGLAIFSSALYFRIREQNDSVFNQALRDRTANLAAFVRIKPRLQLTASAPDEAVGELGRASVWIRVVNSTGYQVASQGPPLAGVPDSFLLIGTPGFHDSGPLRMYVESLTHGGTRVGSIQTITTTGDLQNGTQVLLNAMILGSVVLIGLAGLGGWFIAHVALRPIGRITRVAQEIGGGDLSRRVLPAVRRRRLAGPRLKQDELEALADTFDGMLARLEQADLRRRRLTADVAHELATPIASMKSGAEIAVRRPRDRDEYEAALRLVIDETQHLELIVDDLLLLSRADEGQLPLKRELVELDEVCRQAVRAMEGLAQTRGISLLLDQHSGPVLVVGDEARLGQVVRNLLDNALTHTPREGTVAVEAERVEANGSMTAVLTVRDSGSGIPHTEREHVFERFHRVVKSSASKADGAASGRKGTGLGLAICKALVEAHGGEIAVAETTDRGTSMVVRLPAIDPKAVEPS